MRPHEKLEIYQISHRLGNELHRLSMTLPRFETYEQASQVRRSSKSVSAQIVEGHALRIYRKDYLLYLNRAYASGEETIEHIRYLIETGSGSQRLTDWNQLVAEYDALCRKIYNYTVVVANRPPSRRYHPSDDAPAS